MSRPALDDGAAASRRARRTSLKLALGAAAMFGFGYALVPLYYVICDITGLGGRTNSEALSAAAVDAGVVDEHRSVSVEFVSVVNAGAPWRFSPKLSRMEVKPGEFYRTSFVATSDSEIALDGQGVPSVAPTEAARYFQKIECFCFNRQNFEPFEQKDMPVVFRVDPKLPKHIETITLSYTFYRLPPSGADS